MLRFCLILSAVIAALTLAGCAERLPPEFVAQKHQFKVRFGAEPKVTQVGAGARSTVYSVEEAGGALTVTVTELPAGGALERVPAYLESAKNDLIRAAGGTETADKPITLAGKYPGREFTARFAQPEPGMLRARIYLVGKRLYQVMAIGTVETVNSPRATAFLESFMVTE